VDGGYIALSVIGCSTNGCMTRRIALCADDPSIAGAIVGTTIYPRQGIPKYQRYNRVAREESNIRAEREIFSDLSAQSATLSLASFSSRRFFPIEMKFPRRNPRRPDRRPRLEPRISKIRIRDRRRSSGRSSVSLARTWNRESLRISFRSADRESADPKTKP